MVEGEREGEYICVNIPCAISGTYLQGTLSHLSVRKQRDDDAYVTSSKALGVSFEACEEDRFF